MRIVASDLDHTWVGEDPQALLRLQAAIVQARDELILVYVTGRDLDLYRELARTVGLLAPDYLVASVGTEIYRFPEATLQARWSDWLGAAGWDVGQVDRAAAAFPELTPQPHQFPFKRSFYFTATDPQGEKEVLESLESRLRRNGLDCRIVYSSHRDLDILPRRGGKGEALEFLARQLGIPDKDVVACGDSGNDLDMLARTWNSIVVANAQPELIAARLSEPVYRTSSPASAGVLEGLRHFGFLQHQAEPGLAS